MDPMGESPYLDKPNGFAMNFLGAAPRFCNAVTKKLGTLLYFCWYIFITRPLRCLATGWLREIGLTSIQMHCVYIYILVYVYIYIYTHIDTYEFQILHDAFDFTLYVLYLKICDPLNPNALFRVSIDLHCVPRRGGRSHEVPDDTSLPQNPTKAVWWGHQPSPGLCGQNGVDMFHEVIEVIAARNTLYNIVYHFNSFHRCNYVMAFYDISIYFMFLLIFLLISAEICPRRRRQRIFGASCTALRASSPPSWTTNSVAAWLLMVAVCDINKSSLKCYSSARRVL